METIKKTRFTVSTKTETKQLSNMNSAQTQIQKFKDQQEELIVFEDYKSKLKIIYERSRYEKNYKVKQGLFTPAKIPESSAADSNIGTNSDNL